GHEEEHTIAFPPTPVLDTINTGCLIRMKKEVLASRWSENSGVQ
ncbi:hypothetical protein NPIL_459981, partial [Nephila pilipes]